MKLGCFAVSEQIDIIEELGFDCIELDLGEIAGMSREEFYGLKSRVAASKLGFEVFSGLLPMNVRFHAPDFDEERWMAYVEAAVERAAELGAKIIPLGAGKCRSIPEGCDDVQAAKAHVIRLVERIAGILAQYGVILVVEPLGPAYSNYINTIPEAVDFIGKINLPNCRTMCDLRHMYQSKEPFDHITQYIGEILHAHIDYPKGRERLFPQAGDDYDYTPYFRALHEAGYNGILTIEAMAYQNFARDAGGALEYLRWLHAQ